VFASFGILGLFLNEFIIWFFTEIFSFHYLISKSFYIVIYILIFFARKRLLFK
jgi:putative flippase GtrA